MLKDINYLKNDKQAEQKMMKNEKRKTKMKGILRHSVCYCCHFFFSSLCLWLKKMIKSSRKDFLILPSVVLGRTLYPTNGFFVGR